MKKLITFLSLVLMSGLEARSAARLLRCHFTEPFFRVELDLDHGKLTKIEYDWDDSDPNSEYLYSVIHPAARVETLPVGKSMKISARAAEGILRLQAVLNYQGNNGMSGELYPFTATYSDPAAGEVHGGCDLAQLQSYDRDLVAPAQATFVGHASAALGLCFNRALAAWTLAPSDYIPTLTKFFVLYRGDIIPGEAGAVSQSFGSAERESLAELLRGTQSPPLSLADAKHTRRAMWNYCLQYSGFLRSRFEN